VSGVLALFASPDGDSDATTELLRVVAALRAVGADVRLVECGKGVGVLSSPERRLSADGERYLAAVAEDGVRPEPGADVGEAIANASALVAALDPARAGLPPVHRLIPGGKPGPGELEAILAAGQVTLG
jgi:hypothetical protein